MENIIKDKINLLSNGLLGEIKDIDIQVLKKGKENNVENMISTAIPILIANLSAGISIKDDFGTAKEYNLKEVKSQMDIKAGKAFKSTLEKIKALNYIATSEGKDEYGNIIEDPLKDFQQSMNGNLGIAVDVIDGTTLAAKGLKGAYTLSAIGKNLKKFPDLQSYALLGPKEVVEKFDFFNKPEEEIIDLVNNLSRYYNKPVKDLKIVTSSYDKGEQHQTLIDNMRKLGVQVIIPDPVIIEAPYIISMGLNLANRPDCMIGVLGLPEMVISTLILSNFDTNLDLKFRIASNAMLDNRQNRNLDDIFKFKNNEKIEIKKLKLELNRIYDKLFITSDINNVSFCTTSLTGCDILVLNGIKEENLEVKLESIFGFNGYVYKIIINTNPYKKL